MSRAKAEILDRTLGLIPLETLAANRARISGVIADGRC